jgi:hypothetical protein
MLVAINGESMRARAEAPPHSRQAPEYGWWLEKRIRTTEGFVAPAGAVKR